MSTYADIGFMTLGEGLFSTKQVPYNKKYGNRAKLQCERYRVPRRRPAWFPSGLLLETRLKP